ncbi:TIM barrel protein [Paenibacillus algorifonticola]|uniref:sugar phosphate isomerase/epimerase family protein n=1 Tax=Paenibacillus algorifonticola TaxID=684063 RepID=UPI003D272C52
MSIDKAEYSFSTCWNIKRHQTGSEMIEEIKSLGFRRVELNYNVTTELMKTIEPMIERGDIGVSSVHHVFPHLPGKEFDTDSLMLGYPDKDMRARAVELLIQTVEYAVRYGAEGVVVHPGEVSFPYNIDEELKRIYHAEGRDSAAYQKLWNEMMAVRTKESGTYLQLMQESLEQVFERLAARNIHMGIGIETRSRCYQMPTLQEADYLIKQLAGAPLYLWYDIGHGMMMDRMGLYDNVKEANALKDKILGVHIHETVGLSDHWCPYIHSGDENYFDNFIAIIAAAPIKVYELKDKCTPEDIHLSHERITGKILVK